MQRYRERYPTSEKIGKLRFSDLEVQPLGPTALVLGRWHLTHSDEQLEEDVCRVGQAAQRCRPTISRAQWMVGLARCASLAHPTYRDTNK